MSINPDNITTIRVDQLAEATPILTGNFPHEISGELKRASIQALVDLVASAVGAGSGVGFLPITVVDGQQLPSVPTDPSFFLCGKGTFLNINGFPNIVCTKELNAIMSLSDRWAIAVEIPIVPDLASIGISQSVNNGTIDKAPSENAVYDFVYDYVASQLIKASLGYFDYADLATQTTPISVAPNTQTLLTNDTLGAGTDISQPPYAVNRVYEGSTANEFDFSQLSVGDSVDIRFHFKVTTSANNQLYHIDLKAGIGSASEFENRIFSSYVKTAGVDEQTFVTTFYVGSNDIKDYPAQVFIQSTQSCTVEVVGWFVRVFRKNVNVVGGGGSQTLTQTLALGNQTDGENINISDGDAVILDNGSKLIKGTTNAGLGGNKGIALRCSIDYELKWEGGRLYVMETDGFTIREVSYNFNDMPTVTDDSTKGFVIGSRWVLDNGDLYVCEDASVGVAVWGLQIVGNQDLQHVTTIGNTITSGDYVALFEAGVIEITNQVTGTSTVISADEGAIIKTNNFQGKIKTDLLSLARIYQLPDVDGTIAITDDLTGLMPYAISPPASTISFEKPYIYASFTSPTNNNPILNVLTGARRGVVQKIYHNNATEPTYPAGWVKLFGTYTNSQTNIIYCEWCEGSRVEYWIVEA